MPEAYGMYTCPVLSGLGLTHGFPEMAFTVTAARSGFTVLPGFGDLQTLSGFIQGFTDASLRIPGFCASPNLFVMSGRAVMPQRSGVASSF